MISLVVVIVTYSHVRKIGSMYPKRIQIPRRTKIGKSHLFSIATLNIQYKTLWIPNAVNVLSHQTNSLQCTTAQQIKYNSPKHFLSASKLPAFCSSMFYLTYPPIPLQSYHLFNPCRSTM